VQILTLPVHSVGLYSYMYVQKGCKLSLASFPGPRRPGNEAKLSHDSQYDSHTVNVHYLTSELNTRMMLMYTCTLRNPNCKTMRTAQQTLSS